MQTTEKKPVVVFVFTGYEDGSITFQQSVVQTDFTIVEACMLSVRRWINSSISNKTKCPFYKEKAPD